MCVNRGQGVGTPKGSPQLHLLCRVASWIRVTRDPVPGGPPTCPPLWRSDSQQPPADLQDHPNPELLSLDPHLEHLLPGPNNAPSIAAPKWGGSQLVTLTVLGDQEGAGLPVVTVSAAFQGLLAQVRIWQDLVELPTQHSTLAQWDRTGRSPPRPGSGPPWRGGEGGGLGVLSTPSWPKPTPEIPCRWVLSPAGTWAGQLPGSMGIGGGTGPIPTCPITAHPKLRLLNPGD